MGWPAKKKSVREWAQDTLMLSVSLGRCCMTSFDVSNLPGRQTRVCGRQSSFSMCGSSLTAPPFPSLSLSLSFCVLLSFAVCLCKFYADCRQSHWNDLSTRQALPSESISQLSIQLSDCMTVRQKCLSPCLSVCLCLSVSLHFYPCCGSYISCDLVQLQVHKQQFAWDYNWKAMVDSSWNIRDI